MADESGLTTEEDLQALMVWMQSVIVDPRGDRAVASAETERAAHRVKPTAHLTPYQRLCVYRDQYVARIRDAMRLDYPVLAHYLGPGRFDALMRAYVEAHPPRSYSMYQLSDNIPPFIMRWREVVPDRVFCSELARLELMVSQVSKLPADPAISADALPPRERWATCRLKPVQALSLATFVYPVNGYYQAVTENRAAPTVARTPSWLAVFRIRYDLGRLDMKRLEYRALSSLVDGQTLGEAVSLVTSGDTAVGDEEAQAWIQRWCGLGLFTGVRQEG